MLRLICSLDAMNPEILLEREVEAGQPFEVALLGQHLNGEEPVTRFDSIVLEILYNDENYVLTTDPRSRPVPGELAVNARDAFNLREIRPGTPKDYRGPFSEGSLLTLRPASGDPTGPYKNATGRAGYVSLGEPFEIKAGVLALLAAGRVFALAESNLGVSHLVIRGDVYYKSRPVVTESVVSTVRVVQRKSGPVPGAGPAPLADHGWVP